MMKELEISVLTFGTPVKTFDIRSST